MTQTYPPHLKMVTIAVGHRTSIRSGSAFVPGPDSPLETAGVFPLSLRNVAPQCVRCIYSLQGFIHLVLRSHCPGPKPTTHDAL